MASFATVFRIGTIFELRSTTSTTPLLPSTIHRSVWKTCTGLWMVLACTSAAVAQQDALPLWTADMPIDELMAKVQVTEVPRFVPDTGEHVTYLPNGFRKSTLLEQERWSLVRDDVEVKKVRIIFSKYPLRNGTFDGHTWLTRDRLIELFLLDPDLNRDDIAWEVVMHTDCRNDHQVATLFHGIEIQHAPKPLPGGPADSTLAPATEQASVAQAELLTHMGVLSPGSDPTALPSIDDQQARMIQHLDSLASDTNTVRGKADEGARLAQGRLRLAQFQNTYGVGSDSVVWKVLDRHPGWKQVVVVADWTGSMYGYGAQALQWHVDRFERSGLVWFTLFNDGNGTPDHRKKIGKTGGIYDQSADNVEAVIALYGSVMMKGSGGDGPENPIEALLHAVEKHPAAGEVVLIADNNACVRDMELLDLVDVPVRVVVCGTVKHVNEQLLEIALRTEGSLHTIEEDLYNANVERNARGVPVRFPDLGLKFAKPPCHGTRKVHGSLAAYAPPHTAMDAALKDRRSVEALDLSGTLLDKVPRAVRKLEQLLSLKLNRTGLTTLDGRLEKNVALRVLEIDGNGFTELPGELVAHRYLVRISARENRIHRIAPELARLQFLKELDLGGNPLGELPSRFPTTRIEVLGLSGTGLREWPEVLKRMRRLRELDLSGNTLASVTLGSGLPRTLEVLDLSHCAITDVVLNGAVPPTLRVVDLSGNPLDAETMDRVRAAMPQVKVLP